MNNENAEPHLTAPGSVGTGAHQFEQSQTAPLSERENCMDVGRDQDGPASNPAPAYRRSLFRR